jgi:hypothetical protein
VKPLSINADELHWPQTQPAPTLLAIYPKHTAQHQLHCTASTCRWQPQYSEHQGALVLLGLSSLPQSAGHHCGLTGTTVTCCPSTCTCSGGALPSAAAKAGNSLMYAMPRSPTCDVNVPAPLLLVLLDAAGVLLPAAADTIGSGQGKPAGTAKTDCMPATSCQEESPLLHI